MKGINRRADQLEVGDVIAYTDDVEAATVIRGWRGDREIHLRLPSGHSVAIEDVDASDRFIRFSNARDAHPVGDDRG